MRRLASAGLVAAALSAGGCVAPDAPTGPMAILLVSPSLHPIATQLAAQLKNELALTVLEGAPGESLDKAPCDLVLVDRADLLAPITDRVARVTVLGQRPLALVVSEKAPAVAVAGLGADWVKHIALADPRSGASGAAAEAALARAGVRSAVQTRLLYTASSEQALAKLAAGQADAALVYAAEVGVRPGLRTVELGSEPYSGPRIAVLKAPAHPAAAAALLAMLLNGSGRGVLERAGYTVPQGVPH